MAHRAPPLLLALVASTAVLVGACGGGDGGAASAGPSVPDGFAVELLVDDLSGPTQVVRAPDGRLLVAQLAGSEGAGTGQVVAVDPEEPERRDVLVDGLVTPTGVEVLDGELWADGQVVALARSVSAPVATEVLVSGIEHPQHLVADGDRLLVVDHGGGRIWAVSRDGEG